MKRICSGLLAALLAISLCGCRGADPSADSQPPIKATDSGSSMEDTTQGASDPITERSMQGISLPTIQEAVTNDDGIILMTISFPKVSLYLSNEDAQEAVLGDLQTRIGPILSDAEDIEATARQDYDPEQDWSAYFIDVSYTPTRLDQKVMSLFGNRFSYCGGPHPSLTTDSVTYDLSTGKALLLDEVLAPGCSANALCEKIIAALEPQAENLYYDYKEAVRDRFTSDLHGISDWYFSKNGLCFHFSPYEIAPYSSGTVIAEIPYGALENILLSQFTPVDLPDATGSMYGEICTEEIPQRFSRVAEVAVDDIGSQVLIYSDATVTDVRIERGVRDEGQYIAGATVFAADSVGIGEAIALTADLSSDETLLRLVYRSGNQDYSVFITYDNLANTIALTNL